MKITDNIKSVYTGLGTVRGYMPSADTVKNWAIEPIKSTWSKPAGKAIFIAAGAMATLAIAYTAVKAIRWALQKPEPTVEQPKLYLEFQEKMSDYSIEHLKTWLENFLSRGETLDEDLKTMFCAVDDLVAIKKNIGSCRDILKYKEHLEDLQIDEIDYIIERARTESFYLKDSQEIEAHTNIIDMLVNCRESKLNSAMKAALDKIAG